ncbi:MAG: sugar ABC transporter permease [Actinomycetia bacterium]|nr:sugar ABC transporter permease [Actinomycetes bacterium]
MAMAPARRTTRGGIRKGEALSGWILSAPVLIALFVFLFLPILMTAWVSVSDYNGHGSPLSGKFSFVGADNYVAITSGGGLQEKIFGWSLRNTLWYVVLVVPIVTALSLFLAVIVNGRVLRGRGFFRTAFYFPSVTSSVAIIALWMFLFNASGVVNKMLSWIGIHGPVWFNDPQGIFTALLSGLGLKEAPAALANHGFLGVSWWSWIGGPSWAMTALMLQAIFCTSGTFMLLFIAGLQNLSPEVDEAAIVDGATAWQRFWHVTLPQLKPVLFTVVTLGIIGAWQMFDQVFSSTKGGPGNTTYTLAYRAYSASMIDGYWGQGMAVAFILFGIIILFTILQRFWLRDRPDMPRPPKKTKGVVPS